MFDPLDLIKRALKNAQNIKPNDALSCIIGEIADIEDPENKGRCKVKLPNFTAENDSISFTTDWSNTITTKVFNGKLPKSLIGQTALVFPVMQSYELVVVNISNCLIYGSLEKLPKAGVENLGVQVIELNGQEAFFSTCLLRNGVWAWVSQCDLKHGHASGDSQDQNNDTGGDFQASIEQGVIHDNVFSTAVINYEKESGFTPNILT